MGKKTSASKSGALSYHERKKLARNQFGKCTKRPQENKSFLLLRRELNFNQQRHQEPVNYNFLMNEWTIPEHFLLTIDPIAAPTKNFSFQFVDTVEDFDKMMAILGEIKLIAMDVEGNDEDSYLGMSCLLQIGTWRGVFVIDTLKLATSISTVLRDYLQRSDIVILMHGCANDIKWLKRDFGIYMTAVVDVQLVHQVAHRGNLISFDHLLEKHVPQFSSSDSKKALQQIADWHNRPLHQDLLRYAALDVYGLLYIWEGQKKEDEDGSIIKLAVTRTKTLLENHYIKKSQDFKSELSLMRKKPTLNMDQQEKLIILWEFRNYHAKVVDINEQQLLKMSCLVELVTRSPTSVEEVARIILSNKALLQKSYGTLLKLLSGGRDFLNKILQIQCNNCLRSGHAAFGCWENYSAENTRNYYRLHPALKTKRNKKKRANYAQNVAARKLADVQ